MEKEPGGFFLPDIRRTKKNLQKEICKLINKFEEIRTIKVIKVCYELEQKEGETPNLALYHIKPEEIYIKLEDI